MAKTKLRYILKKTSLSGRGGGAKVDAWYVYDNEQKRPVSDSASVKLFVQQLCDTYNKMHIDKEFENEVLK